MGLVRVREGGVLSPVVVGVADGVVVGVGEGVAATGLRVKLAGTEVTTNCVAVLSTICVVAELAVIVAGVLATVTFVAKTRETSLNDPVGAEEMSLGLARLALSLMTPLILASAMVLQTGPLARAVLSRAGSALKLSLLGSKVSSVETKAIGLSVVSKTLVRPVGGIVKTEGSKKMVAVPAEAPAERS